MAESGSSQIRAILAVATNGKPCTLANLAEAKRLPAEFLGDPGIHDLPERGAGITYYDVTDTLYVHREPDRGGDVKVMQGMNIAVDALKKLVRV
jgi:hypothetical protein